jgi:predicted DNA-binding ribbon-helix-helix protein
MDTIPTEKRRTGMPRASVTLRPDVYETLEHIAREKKVSLAWVLREAAETYIAARWPLFPPQKDPSA